MSNYDTSVKTIETITNNSVYKQVLADSFGGVMYNVANKYDAKELLALWETLSPAMQGASGGIMQGAFNFLKGDEV